MLEALTFHVQPTSPKSEHWRSKSKELFRTHAKLRTIKLVALGVTPPRRLALYRLWSIEAQSIFQQVLCVLRIVSEFKQQAKEELTHTPTRSDEGLSSSYQPPARPRSADPKMN